MLNYDTLSTVHYDALTDSDYVAMIAGTQLEGLDSLTAYVTSILSEVAAIKARMPLDGTVATTDDIPELDVSALATATALAEVQTTADSIKSKTDNIPTIPVTTSDITALRTHGDAEWATATGFATSEDVTLTTTTETVNVTTQAIDLSGVATASSIAEVKSVVDTISSNALTSTDLQGLTVDLSEVAKTSELTAVQNAILERGNAAWSTATGFATPSDVQLTVDGDITMDVDLQDITNAVWTAEERTLTSDGSTLTAQDVWDYGNRTLTGYASTLPEDELTGTAYCMRQDVERRWGIVNVRQWADIDNDGDNAKIQTQIDWAIQSATGKIESDLQSSVYILPFSHVPREVRYHAAALAGVELFHLRSMAATKDSPTINRAETEYQAWLTAVLSGVVIAGAETIA